MNDFAAQVQALRPPLLRFARNQLRNDAWAEDAVSETLLAALEKPQSFGGQSQLKTWLVGILKHKVIDQLRRHAREATILSRDDEADLDDQLFVDNGHWREAPKDWGDPEHQLRQQQFFDVLELCVTQLPPTQGRVFMMREWLELDTAEVCQELAITSSNLWVLMHRARLRLRQCLQDRWFDATERPR
ncbi:MAG: sigma-70 family RNA polymerase sigma factor [Rubrivivax sp.]|nr:sigma-70 family RNA polymerase sigma factor [Rubrivivax sp.]